MKKNITITLCVVSVLASMVYYSGIGRSEPKYLEEIVNNSDAQSRWIKTLNHRNPELHDVVLAAMLASKHSKKEVFVQSDNYIFNRLKYKLSYERGGAENILSYNYNNRYFSFDHYTTNHGPSLANMENQIVIDRKISKFYRELNIK